MRHPLVLAIAAAACIHLPLAAAADAPDYKALQSVIYDDQISPGYALFADKAHILDYETIRHCKNTGDAPDMLAVRTKFHDALDAWQAVQHIRHGAVGENDRHARLQFWPDKRGITERHMRKILAEPESETLKDHIAASSVATQGFPALERLLFGDIALSQHMAPGEKAVRCRIAEAITHNIAAIAYELKASGQPENVDPKAEVAAILGDLVTGLEFIQSLKLKLPADKEHPRAHLFENWRSGRSLRNVEINIRALRELYKHLAVDAGDDDPRHRLILDQFQQAEASVRAMGESGKVLLSKDKGPVRIRALAGTLESLRDMIAQTMPDRLKVNLGFNSLDGD